MKNTYIILMLLLLIGCKSVTTYEDVQEQEDEARTELNEAQDEMLELAEVKEEYSIDVKTEMIESLEKRQKQINSDIKNLNKIESDGLAKSSESMIKGLEKEDDEIRQRIMRLEKEEQENWQAATDSITNLISQLEKKIDDITANLENQGK